MSDVRQWLESLGLGEYADAFVAHEIDWDVIPRLDHETLKEIGVPSVGARMRLLRAIESLDAGQHATAADQTDAMRDTRAADAAERRQLTIMFADLVGSTQLSQQLDPEELREINRAYQSTATSAIEELGGYVARYMGDGVLAYFGYPQAHEDDAERAVRAGLALARAVPTMDAHPALAVRVGIATGLVVVGDLIGDGAAQESAVVGETPNLAARLQGVAEPNTVVLSESTQRLVAGRFVMRTLGARNLKGISTPVPIYQATSLRHASSRFDSMHSGALTPLSGREIELALLEQRWQRARCGEGQVVLLEGEPGIGKSRLLTAIRETVGPEASSVQQYQCSPYHTATALRPVIDHLERAAGIAPQDAVDARLDKIEASMNEWLPGNERAVALIAAQLGLPIGRYEPLRMTPQRQRAETITALVRLMEAFADQGPMLMLFEDMHWSDPTTLELLSIVIGHIQTRPILALITYRPEFNAAWTGHGHVTEHSLERLGRRAARGIVEKVDEAHSLPSDVVEAIVARADGVPLFVEELTKTVLESAASRPAGGTPAGGGAGLAIPATVQDALTARIDRLGESKDVAQLAACIGRAFSHELLAAVSALEASTLHAALSRLIASGLVFQHGEPPEATYTFKHALVQDVARESLLRSKRRRVHGRIAEVLEERFHQTNDVEPELLAHHSSQAGLTEKAARYWMAAGTVAIGRSDYLEALAHLDNGLLELEDLPASDERTLQALQLQTARAEALLATRGYIADATLDAYHRAREHCAELRNPAQIFPVLRGIFNGHVQRGELGDAGRVACECLALARVQDDPAPLSLAHRMVAQSAFLTADFLSARKHSERALALYDPDLHGGSAITYGIDLKSGALLWLAQSLCMLGHLDRALSAVLANRAHCRQLGYAFNLALTTSWLCYMRLQRREYRACVEQADELLALAKEHQLADFIVAAEAHGTLARCATAASGADLEGAQDCIKALTASWDTFLLPFNLGILAAAELAAKRTGPAQATIDRALALAWRTGERWSEAELHRLRAEIRISRGDPDQAEACFKRSLETARRQHARLWELRAATGLAGLLRDRGEHRAAHELLAPVYDSFTEGFDTNDLRDAQAALSALS